MFYDKVLDIRAMWCLVLDPVRWEYSKTVVFMAVMIIKVLFSSMTQSTGCQWLEQQTEE